MVSSQISKNDGLESNEMKKTEGVCIYPPSSHTHTHTHKNDVYGEGYHDYALRSVRNS